MWLPESLVLWELTPSAAAPEPARPTWSCDPRQEKAGPDWEVHQLLRKERAILCSPGVILASIWDGPGAFAKKLINCPNFCMAWVGPPPSQSLLSPLGIRPTGLYGPAPLPVPF